MVGGPLLHCDIYRGGVGGSKHEVHQSHNPHRVSPTDLGLHAGVVGSTTAASVRFPLANAVASAPWLRHLDHRAKGEGTLPLPDLPLPLPLSQIELANTKERSTVII